MWHALFLNPRWDRVKVSLWAYAFVLLVAVAFGLSASYLTLKNTGIDPRRFFTAQLLAVSVVSLIVGKFIEVAVVGGVLKLSGGSELKKSREKRDITLIVWICEIPMAIRDLILSGVMLSPLGSAKTLSISFSPFDPFIIWSIFVCWYLLKKYVPSAETPVRRRLVILYAAYFLVIKIALFVLGLVAR